MTFKDYAAVFFAIVLALLSLASIAAAASSDLHGNRQLQAEYVGFDALAHQVFSYCGIAGDHAISPSAPNTI